jgi:gas vesicle protein
VALRQVIASREAYQAGQELLGHGRQLTDETLRTEAEAQRIKAEDISLKTEADRAMVMLSPNLEGQFSTLNENLQRLVSDQGDLLKEIYKRIKDTEQENIERDNEILRIRDDSPFFGKESDEITGMAFAETAGITEAFLEELIVRRELSINFVYYNPYYESFNCLPDWAKKTLKKHLR